MSDIYQNSASAVVAVIDTDTDTRRERRTNHQKKPKQEPNYHVIIWNDEEHTYDYVIEMLQQLFRHPFQKAFQITKEVDLRGRGIAMTCHRELAELKCEQILSYGADWRMPTVSRSSIWASIEPCSE